jgi:pyruvate/2-oxoglutarate dehydrogenase complex dihydrolipoamide dehydrogenase (E3) component
MAKTTEADICVIGGGSGGLAVAAGAAMFGVRTVLVEKGKMGGDCLNYGCVPSKALLAAAKHAKKTASDPGYGVTAGSARVDFASVQAHVRGVIEAIAPVDSVQRFEGLGVDVIQAAARFVGPREIEAGDRNVRGKRFVIATGSSPSAPPIPGLDETPFFTNETIFENTDLPDHLIIVGGGPIGLEMAQAHRRLGSQVTVLEAFRVFSKDDPELAQIVVRQLQREGVVIEEGAKVSNVAATDGGVAITIESAGGDRTISGTHLLVAAGRAANVEGLNLEVADVAYSKRGIEVDRRLRTSNRRIFAIGDVSGGLQFTHMAGYEAGIVIRNALFRVPTSARTDATPWVTYTDPELAHVGLGEEQAKKKHGSIRVLRWPLAENDRAQAERSTAGAVKVITTPRGRILGATIAAPNGGDLLQPWILAISKRLNISAMASLIVPYPTMGEINKRAAGSFFTPTLFSARTRWLVSALNRLG